nr:uncharacterized protein LOC112282829 [Physcomitrium patens]|eukprot:XP_024376675.1 uncharacterized protein LOC112282829 [Physcomitrella patens]
MRLKISEVAQALRRSKTSRNAKIYRVVVVVGSKLPFSDDAFHQAHRRDAITPAIGTLLTSSTAPNNPTPREQQSRGLEILPHPPFLALSLSLSLSLSISLPFSHSRQHRPQRQIPASATFHTASLRCNELQQCGAADESSCVATHTDTQRESGDCGVGVEDGKHQNEEEWGTGNSKRE